PLTFLPLSRTPPTSTLFPYTTLFRSAGQARPGGAGHGRGDDPDQPAERAEAGGAGELRRCGGAAAGRPLHHSGPAGSGSAAGPEAGPAAARGRPGGHRRAPAPRGTAEAAGERADRGRPHHQALRGVRPRPRRLGGMSGAGAGTIASRPRPSPGPDRPVGVPTYRAAP